MNITTGNFNDELDMLWNSIVELAESSTGPPENQAETPPAPPPAKTVPKIGTRVQRSDATNQRKAVLLATPPPPLPGKYRRGRKLPPTGPAPVVAAVTRGAPQNQTARQAPPAAQARADPSTGPGRTDTEAMPPPPAPPSRLPATPTRQRRPERPPIEVEIASGRKVLVPYHAATISRKYQLRLKDGHWLHRFTREGRLRHCRRRPLS
ncbi:PREDICTED: uncharacterized protein LOC105556468 [Vollenhovia emeryi]|uniref:uncharacterized protein LOC105556468 n=1 Tax=Vollenhovia emeryi TaxID=411798 RepID=UPI0005F4DA17|nr:PREDICTED: uncharacterized protein LOC105556468 [Vollenhovia emeryi]